VSLVNRSDTDVLVPVQREKGDHPSSISGMPSIEDGKSKIHCRAILRIMTRSAVGSDAVSITLSDIENLNIEVEILIIRC